jgi:hypothetical protein
MRMLRDDRVERERERRGGGDGEEERGASFLDPR